MLKYLFLVLFLLCSSFSYAMEVPVKIQVPLLYKVFNFEKNIQSIQGDTIKIAVVYNAADADSVTVKDEVLEAFVANAAKKIRNKSCEAVAVDNQSDLSSFHVVYLTPGNDDKLDSLVNTCNSNGILSVTGVTEYINKGVTLALGKENNKPKLFINKSAAQLSGVSFSATLLTLARVI